VRVIGVIDLLRGHAVHARAGRRDRYRAVQTVAGTAIDSGDAVALARVYVEQLTIEELYVADLDALGGRSPQEALVAALAALGVPLLLDAAVTSVEQARHALTLGADRVVVALETLASFDALDDICNALGGNRVAFSLDLRNGQPIISSGGGIAPDEPADAVAARASRAGAGTVIVIDLARVGTGSGLDFELLGRVREAAPGLTLLAGGGVRGADDLVRLAAAGCDGALVASALHDGRIGGRDLAAAARYRSVSR
jgi:phosphoribosylformimino-5-aminoimidazole carboxamide ribotide isomerase